MAKPDTVLGVLKAAEGWFVERGVDAPRRSAEFLMGHVLELTRLQVYMQHDRPMSVEERDSMRALVARRGQHEPLAYLLGDWEFYGHRILVSPAVLIPRPETEGLVERALAAAPSGARCVDIGTGSGAIPIALCKERADLEVWAVDVSADALAVARQNVALHGLEDRVHLVESSYWDAVDAELRFELLVSNPPYVDPAQPELVADDVAKFEPDLALYTPAGDPAAPYRAILAEIGERLVPGAEMIFETGVGAAEPALDVLRSDPRVSDAQLLEDEADLPRYLVAGWRQVV